MKEWTDAMQSFSSVSRLLDAFSRNTHLSTPMRVIQPERTEWTCYCSQGISITPSIKGARVANKTLMKKERTLIKDFRLWQSQHSMIYE
jgi:hypothetical protein